MYQQSEHDQETIRQLFPDKTHCRWLKDCPSACDALPFDVEKVAQGNPCPNNPFEKYYDLLVDHAESDSRVIIEEANRWDSIIELGLVPDLDKITAIEFQFASVVKRYAKSLELSSRMGIF